MVRAGGMAPLRVVPTFTAGDDILAGRPLPVSGSPDGRYLSYLRQVSSAYGDLVLYDVAEMREQVVSRRVEIDLSQPACLWSPDSSFLVYSKGNRLYYLSLDQLRQGRALGEGLRELGPGSLQSVRWGRETPCTTSVAWSFTALPDRSSSPARSIKTFSKPAMWLVSCPRRSIPLSIASGFPPVKNAFSTRVRDAYYACGIWGTSVISEDRYRCVPRLEFLSRIASTFRTRYGPMIEC